MTEQVAPTNEAHAEPESRVIAKHRPGAQLGSLVPGEELWESTVAGSVWVNITNKRDEIEGFRIQAGQRLRITKRDREMNQDRIRAVKHDPFTNGMLKRLDADQNDDPRTETPDALTVEEILAIFAKTGAQFERKVSSLSEVPIRRMRDLAGDVDATQSQLAFLDKIIADRYSVGGTSPTYEELKRLGQVAAQTD
jgi:hypothetical protein